MKQKLVVVGNGMAGMRTVEHLLELEPDLYEITVFGSEPYGNYNRILLSPVLSGEKTVEEIILNDDDWYADNAITLHKGKEITKIDRRKRIVTTKDGIDAPYDWLLLATGSDPVIIPVPGHDLPGVVTFRNIHDVEVMLGAAESKTKAVIIGGGLLGLEAAYGLMNRGMDVTVVHLVGNLMERQLDDPAAAMLRRSLESRGMKILTDAETKSIEGTDGVTGVLLADGTELPADIVVMVVGIRPNAALARDAGIYCEKGVVTGDTMQTYDPRVYAVGECVEHRGMIYGLVAPLFEQAKVCASHLAQRGHIFYQGSAVSTRLKVSGIDLFSAGDFMEDENSETLVLKDEARGIYKKLVIRDNRIIGAVILGDAVDGTWYYQLLRDGVDISANRDRLLFGQASLGDSGHSPENAVINMDDDAEICGCNGVCKGEIVGAIIEKKLFTLDDVRAHTKASSSCGSCTGQVEQLLAFTLGGEFSEGPKEKPLCKCTDYTHDEVKGAIRENGLKSIPGVMAFLEWGTEDGCAGCRPALNYYLICAWPGEYENDQQSRLINERVHANIQKNGLYSVVPRMFGGMTTSDELRAIADVADKFNVPSLHLTGGQRIDLIGVEKEALPAVWRDLGKAGMVSGHAYGKAVRTVKTCVGSEWCRFGTQDSSAIGIEIEKMCWGAWTPQKFKMAVSGCPRNCAEATIKDFGVVAVESGWELHVGGNGGVKVRSTDFLCKVETAEEVIEYTGAFIQFYREEANYLERTAPWVERVGLSHIKQRIVEDTEGRQTLHGRFLYSQEFSQNDPWLARADGGEDAHEFNILKMVG